jgi:integrase/recombinase XerD
MLSPGTPLDRAILSTMRFTACRAGAVAKLRLGDFQHDGE